MKVHFENNEEYTFKFYQRSPNSVTSKISTIAKTKSAIQKPGTSCVLLKGDQKLDEVHLALHHKDRFERKVGRKYALIEIMDRQQFTREQRKKIWNEYLKKHKV